MYYQPIEVFGFSASVEPLLHEPYRQGSPEYSKLKYPLIRDPGISAEDIQAIIRILPQMNAVSMPYNFDLKLDLNWLLPIADQIITIDGRNYIHHQLLNQFKNVRMLQINRAKQIDISHLYHVIDIFGGGVI